MIGGRLEVFAVGLGVAYLGVLVWSMTNLSYDIWGALILLPVYGVLGVALVGRLFQGALQPAVKPLLWGLPIKAAGAAARYWVGFEAYDGGIDAGRYHEFAIVKSGEIWSGERPVSDVIPSHTGTEFVDDFTAFVYTISGGSQLGGFLTFSFLAYVGIVFIVRAAAVAVPGLAVKKFAWLCVVFPSIVYWPSSMGKEALVLCGLGIGTYGIALLLARRQWMSSIILITIGLGFTALIRPHMAGIWIAAALPAIFLATIFSMRAGKQDGGRASSVGLVFVLIIATVAFGLIASFTLRFLETPSYSSTSGSVTDIFAETARRTSQAGSNYVPPSVANPLQWPYAIARTILRPLPIEARGIAQLLSAVEIAALAALYAWSWKRLRGLPKALMSQPFVVFAVTAILLSGLAFASFANLGVLTRQKTLIFPLLLLLPCLPSRKEPRPATAESGADAAKQKSPVVVGDEVRQHEPVASGRLSAADIDQFWAGPRP